MKLAREMQLETMRQEDEKTSVVEQKIESTLQQQEEAEKVLKADVTNQKEQMRQRLIQRKRSRAASQGLNNTFSFSLNSKNELEVDVNQVIKPFVGSSALAGIQIKDKPTQGNLTTMIDISSTSIDEPVKRPA